MHTPQHVCMACSTPAQLHAPNASDMRGKRTRMAAHGGDGASGPHEIVSRTQGRR